MYVRAREAVRSVRITRTCPKLTSHRASNYFLLLSATISLALCLLQSVLLLVDQTPLHAVKLAVALRTAI